MVKCKICYNEMEPEYIGEDLVFLCGCMSALTAADRELPLMKEDWRDIPGFSNYCINRNGCVVRKADVSKPFRDPNNRVCVNIKDDEGKWVKKTISRLLRDVNDDKRVSWSKLYYKDKKIELVDNGAYYSDEYQYSGYTIKEGEDKEVKDESSC